MTNLTVPIIALMLTLHQVMRKNKTFSFDHSLIKSKAFTLSPSFIDLTHKLRKCNF